MKVTLDLDHLLERGEITQLECERLKQLAAHETASLTFNILIGFGVIAVSGASLALLPTAASAITLGLVISGLGIGLISAGHEQRKVLANICVLVGALTRIIHERFCCNRGFAAATRLRRAGSPLTASTYCFKYASVSRGSACPSRHATAQFRHEPS
ncbi:MAG: hypothetical protein OEW25_09465 [Nitrospira sp.]|nr:hypothetical protein [Nitrospira sp.]